MVNISLGSFYFVVASFIVSKTSRARTNTQMYLTFKNLKTKNVLVKIKFVEAFSMLSESIRKPEGVTGCKKETAWNSLKEITQ